MKFLRYGPAGQEKPALMDEDGRIRDLSQHVPDINGATLAPERLASLAAYKPRARARGLRSKTPPRVPCRLGLALVPLVRHVTVPQLAQGAFMTLGPVRIAIRTRIQAPGASPGTAGQNATPRAMPPGPGSCSIGAPRHSPPACAGGFYDARAGQDCDPHPHTSPGREPGDCGPKRQPACHAAAQPKSCRIGSPSRTIITGRPVFVRYSLRGSIPRLR